MPTPDHRSLNVTATRTRTIVETATFQLTADLTGPGLSPEQWSEDRAQQYAHERVLAGDPAGAIWVPTEQATVDSVVIEQATPTQTSPEPEALHVYDLTVSGSLGVPASATPHHAHDGRIVGFNLPDGTQIQPHIVLEHHTPETDTYTDLTFTQATEQSLYLDLDGCEFTPREEHL